MLRSAKVYGSLPVRWAVNAYVEFIRNTPFLIQLYFVFFACRTSASA